MVIGTVAVMAAAMVCAGAAMRAGGAAGVPLEKAQTGFLFKTVEAGGKKMDYAVYVPREYSGEKKWPAIVFLHGSGESGTDGQKMIAQGIGTNVLWNAKRWPCIVMFPQKPVERDQWEAYDAAVMAMLEETKSAYSVDGDRIALTGLSQGGHGCWSIGSAHAEVWCAVAAICGYADAHAGGITAEQIAGKMKGVPMWIFHGDDDDVVLPEESKKVAAAMTAAGGDVKLTLYPKVNHGSWDKAYQEGELPGFLMKGKKK
jgi:predicted peptidase